MLSCANGWSLALRYGKIALMAEWASDPDEVASDPGEPASDPKSRLREDLSKEYYEILKLIQNLV
jgi:hypothetical protein